MKNFRILVQGKCLLCLDFCRYYPLIERRAGESTMKKLRSRASPLPLLQLKTAEYRG